MSISIHGKDKILMFRNLKDAKSKEAAKLALQTSHTLTYERNADFTQTKDGALSSPGVLETTLEIEAVTTVDPVNLMLEKSVIDGDVLEIWEINYGAGKDEQGKYSAKYMRGRLSNWELPADADDFATVSCSISVDGIPQEGKVTLSAEQESEIKYAFKDLTVQN